MKKTESKTKRVNLFKKRLDTYYDELKQLYLDIYHDENAFNYFVTMLKKNLILQRKWRKLSKKYIRG